jgi:hypothetical protein
MIGGPINPRTSIEYGTESQKWKDAEDSAGEIIVSHQENDMLNSMALSVQCHNHAREMLLRCEHREVTVRTEIEGVAVQGRIDATDLSSTIIDLKTTRDIDDFAREARRYMYTHQMAMYRRMMYNEIDKVCDCYLVVVEKQQPYRVGVFRITNDNLDVAYDEVREAIIMYRGCVRSGVWPTGYETVQEL